MREIGKNRSPEDIFPYLPSGISRRDFLKGLLATTAATGITSCETNSGENNVTTGREAKDFGVEPLREFSEFRNFSKVLVLCANEIERLTVIQTLRESSLKRGPRTKFSMIDTRTKIANAVIPTKKIIDKGAGKGNFPSGLEMIKVIVVAQDNPKLAELGNDFGVVQLRGHTADMPSLIQLFKQHHSETSILFMGGCEAVQFMKDLHSPNIAMIAGKMGVQANSAQNTYALMRLIDQARLTESWDEFHAELRMLSGNLRDHTIMPGHPDYYAYASGKKKS